MTDEFSWQMASNVDILWCVIGVYEETIEQTVEFPMSWETLAFIWRPYNVIWII